MVGEVDFGDGAFSHADGRAAVAGDQAAHELEERGIVADSQDAFAVGVFGQHILKIVIFGSGSECLAYFHLGVVAQFGSDKLRGLEAALERAGDDYIYLYLERAEDPSHQHALLLAFLDERALAVESGALTGDSGIGVAH